MSMDQPKPRFRGRLHQIAFFVSVPLGGALVAAAGTAVARISSAIYAVTLTGLYAVSAAYHRVPWGPRAWALMRRLDHSMIFLLIAGTYTPFALLVLPSPWSTSVLLFVWIGALGGITLRLLTQRLAALRNTLYLVLGWTALITLPVTVQRLGPVALGFMVAGGLFYTAGAIMFSLRKPDPVPAVFGYHEVWHVMVIGGSACHYVLIMTLVLGT
jgi:hemolysin III